MGSAVICLGGASLLRGFKEPIAIARDCGAVTGGIFLLLGFWTPLAGALLTIDELSSQRDGQWIHILLAVLAAGTAMVGPGAWSIDAVRFGRKRFDLGRGRRKSGS